MKNVKPKKMNKASRKLLRFIGNMSDQDQKSLIKAIEDTEQEIELLNIVHLANKLETIGEWELASEQWESIGRKQDAELCREIATKVKERKENVL